MVPSHGSAEPGSLLVFVFTAKPASNTHPSNQILLVSQSHELINEVLNNTDSQQTPWLSGTRASAQ